LIDGKLRGTRGIALETRLKMEEVFGNVTIFTLKLHNIFMRVPEGMERECPVLSVFHSIFAATSHFPFHYTPIGQQDSITPSRFISVSQHLLYLHYEIMR
jgi:hypothetical protein